MALFRGKKKLTYVQNLHLVVKVKADLKPTSPSFGRFNMNTSEWMTQLMWTLLTKEEFSLKPGVAEVLLLNTEEEHSVNKRNNVPLSFKWLISRLCGAELFITCIQTILILDRRRNEKSILLLWRSGAELIVYPCSTLFSFITFKVHSAFPRETKKSSILTMNKSGSFLEEKKKNISK